MWGAHDKYLGRQLAHPGSKLASNCRVQYVEQAGHFVHHDCPELVTESLVAFLRSAHPRA